MTRSPGFQSPALQPAEEECVPVVIIPRRVWGHVRRDLVAERPDSAVLELADALRYARQGQVRREIRLPPGTIEMGEAAVLGKEIMLV